MKINRQQILKSLSDADGGGSQSRPGREARRWREVNRP